MAKDLVGITSDARSSAKKSGLSVVDMACADLVSCGWTVSDAWAVCVRSGFTWEKSALRRAQIEMSEAPAFQERVKSTRSSIDGSYTVPVDSSKENGIMEATSKENLILALLNARSGLPVGSKEYIDATMKIADLTNAKKEENKSEVELIHYHLPLKCSMCSLKRAHDEAKNK